MESLQHLIFLLHSGIFKPITDDNLLVVTNDFSDITGNRAIVFTVIHPPKLGRLVRVSEDNITEEISSFTQNMVCVLFWICGLLVMWIFFFLEGGGGLLFELKESSFWSLLDCG